MDSKGHLYFDPPQELVKSKKLTPVNRELTTREVKAEKIGRNSPCGCGSGLKFKRCCYGKSADERLEAARAVGDGKQL